MYHRYGIDYGNVHVVMMSTEHDFTASSEQYNFLDDHMKSINRSVTPWLIFAGHRPMYVDSTDTAHNFSDQPVATLLRQHIEPLLKVILQYKWQCLFTNSFRNMVLIWHYGDTTIHTKGLVQYIMRRAQVVVLLILLLAWEELTLVKI